MGVTIFYSGTIRSTERDPLLLHIALKWAKRWKCDVVDVDDQQSLLIRMRDGESIGYRGPAKGFILRPHPDAESLGIVYSPDGYVWRFCKTQFAGPRIHIEVVEFLNEIAPFFKDFKITDDGGYWPKKDRTELERRMGLIGDAINELGKTFPRSKDHGDHTPKSGLN